MYLGLQRLLSGVPTIITAVSRPFLGTRHSKHLQRQRERRVGRSQLRW